MQADRGGEQLIILPSNNTTMASIVSIHKGAISGTQMLVVTNNCLVGLKTYSTRGKSLLVLEMQPYSWANEVINLQRESTTSPLLDQHNSYYILNRMLTSKGKSSYHPSSKRPLFRVHENLHKKPQLCTVHRQTDVGTPTPVDTSTSQILNPFLERG